LLFGRGKEGINKRFVEAVEDDEALLASLLMGGGYGAGGGAGGSGGGGWFEGGAQGGGGGEGCVGAFLGGFCCFCWPGEEVCWLGGDVGGWLLLVGAVFEVHFVDVVMWLLWRRVLIWYRPGFYRLPTGIEWEYRPESKS
jgi:hypothetical protein